MTQIEVSFSFDSNEVLNVQKTRDEITNFVYALLGHASVVFSMEKDSEEKGGKDGQ